MTVTFRLQEASAGFFAQVGGTVIDTAVEPLEPEPDEEPALGATVTVAFDNAGIFGDDRSDIYDDVYPRYRALRSAWWHTLSNTLDDPTPLRPYLLPLPAQGAPLGPPLPARSRPGAEFEVVPLDAVPRSSYLDRLRREYGLEYGLRGSGGRLHDLAEGLLLATRAATDTLPEVESFVELGAGTGAIAAMVLRRTQPKRALLHDSSQAVMRHLREHLGPLAIQTGTNLDVVSTDCRELPFADPVSLLVVGLPYALVPSLLARSGQRIRAALGDDGLLVAATSTVGMRFYQALTDGSEPRVTAWPWYVAGATLRDLFGSGAMVRVRNVVISVVAASTARVDATVAGRVSRGAESLA
jgi:hypothetical protein